MLAGTESVLEIRSFAFQIKVSVLGLKGGERGIWEWLKNLYKRLTGCNHTMDTMNIGLDFNGMFEGL